MNKDEHLEVLADLDTRSAAVPLAEYLAAGRRRTGRECGSCSLCCKLPHIDIPELKKPRDTWCPHCRPGKGGCSIYQTRPGLCKAYTCLWLADPALGEEWKPSRCKIVVHFDPDGLAVLVDPAFPNRWREAPYYDVIKRAALHGLRQTGPGHRKTQRHLRIVWLGGVLKTLRNLAPARLGDARGAAFTRAVSHAT